MRTYPVILLFFFIVFLGIGCKPKMCPIDACQARKIHYHDGTKFRGVPWWKFWKSQNPDVGEDWKDPKPEKNDVLD